MNANPPLKNPLRQTKKRMEGVFYAFGGLFLLLAAKVLYMQTVPTAGLSLSDKTFERHDILPARRGQILAFDGTTMAVTIDEYTVSANPRGWSDKQKDEVAQKIAATIGGDLATYRAELNKVARADGSKNYYVRLAQHVDEDRANRLKDLIGPQKK